MRSRAQEDARTKFVDERDARAREELGRTERKTVFDGEYRGREVQFMLLRPVEVEHGQIKRVILRQGVNGNIIARLRDRPTFDEPNFDVAFDLGSVNDKSISKGDERTASLQIGNIFRSELILD